MQEFWIDRYEVTNTQFKRFLERYPAWLSPLVQRFDRTAAIEPVDWQEDELPAVLEAYPVRGIDWEVASRYCAWLGKRLPTESEWEAAARGPRGWLYPWGNEENGVQLPANYTYPVGSIPTNRSYFGLFDMAGNVWEWVSKPFTPVNAGQQIFRGGAYDLRYDMTSAMAGPTRGDSHHAGLVNTGFRCAADGTHVQKVAADELLAIDDDFTLINSGWPDDAKMDKVDATWNGILQSLKTVVETGDVSGKQKVTLFFMRNLMFLMPAKTKAGNVTVPD